MNAQPPGSQPPENQLPANKLPGNLPVLTQLASLDELPTLTEIVAPADPPPAAPALGEKEMQQLLKQLEAHLDAVFTQKLNLHLEKLQRLAVKQAVSEFRAALPQLLRDALNK